MQQNIEKKVCTIEVQLDSEDPIGKLTRVMTQLKSSESELKKL